MTQLIFTNKTLRPLIKSISNEQTLIVTDAYNFPIIGDLKQSVVVEDQDIMLIDKTKRNFSYTNVVAVGGCTALDVGRACAVGEKVIAVPTILSNACLSTNLSVINKDGKYGPVKTIAPSKTIISKPTIVNNHKDIIKSWSASGVGDLFARISASIGYEYKKRSLSSLTMRHIRANVPVTFEALEWFENKFKKFDWPTLKKLAQYLHTVSARSVHSIDKIMFFGDEHKLYYRLQENQKYSKMKSTHGKIVSIGTLLSARIFGEMIADFEIYDRLRKVWQRVGLPLTYRDLKKIDIKKEHLVRALSELKRENKSLFQGYFMSRNYKILDVIYGKL